MPQITYIAHDGTRYVQDVAVGVSVMEGAIKNGVPGIDAECGGACSCATCHVKIDPAWADRVGGPNEIEEAMLEAAPAIDRFSRLSCQIRVAPEFDGLIVHIPEAQH